MTDLIMTREQFYINGIQAGKQFTQITKEWAASPWSKHKEKSVKQKLEEAVLTGIVYDEPSCHKFIKDNGSENDNKAKTEYWRQVSFALKAATIGIQALTEMRSGEKA